MTPIQYEWDHNTIAMWAAGREVREEVDKKLKWSLQEYRIAWRALALYDEGLTVEEALEQAKREYGEGGDVK